MFQHTGRDGALLDDAAAGRKVAEHRGEAAGRGIRLGRGAYNVVVFHPDVRDVFADRMSGDGGQRGIQQAERMKFRHDGRHAAGGVQVLHVMRARGRQMAQVRGDGADFIDQFQ